MIETAQESLKTEFAKLICDRLNTEEF